MRTAGHTITPVPPAAGATNAYTTSTTANDTASRKYTPTADAVLRRMKRHDAASATSTLRRSSTTARIFAKSITILTAASSSTNIAYSDRRIKKAVRSTDTPATNPGYTS